LVVLLVFGGQFGREKIEISFAEDFTQRTPERLAKPLVREGELLGEVFAEDILGEGFDK
jgi:hypothetical protein